MASTLSQGLLLSTAEMPVTSEEPTDTGTLAENVTIETVTFVCSAIITPTLCVLGLIGNGLGISVLWKDNKQHNLSIYLYLWALTLTDTIYLGIGLVRTIPSFVRFYDEGLSAYMEPHMNKGFIYLDMVFSHTSVAIIVIMSIERFLALAMPLKVKGTVFAKYPKQLIVVCFLSNVLFLLPYALYFEVRSIESGNATTHILQFKEYIAEDMEVFMIVEALVDYFVPVSILLVTNIAIPMQYYRISKYRKTIVSTQSYNANNRQTKITFTVFIMTILYLFLCIPNLTVKIWAFVDDGYSFDGDNRLVYWLLVDISNVFAYINATNDFLIFIIISDVYRKVFKSIYCKLCCPQGDAQDAAPRSLPATVSNTVCVTEMFSEQI